MNEREKWMHPQTADDFDRIAGRNGKKNHGYQHERVPYNFREMAFAKAWEKENQHGGSFGYGRLQELFFSPGQMLGSLGRCLHIFTAIERCIVATVIQWLGTNVGWGFLESTLKDAGYEIVEIPPERRSNKARRLRTKYEKRRDEWQNRRKA